MKKGKIPLSRKGGKVIYILLILVVVSSGEIVKSENKSLKTNVNYEDKIVTLDSYKKQTTKKTVKKSSKKKTKTVTTSTKKTKSANKKKVTKNIKGKSISNYAIQFNGNPYVHGGTSLTKGADCSGFTQSVYKKFGKSLPRTVEAQSKVGTKISFSNLQPGDLVFYSNGGSKPTHVAIYIGNGKIIHASTPKNGIKISTVNIMKKVVARRINL